MKQLREIVPLVEFKVNDKGEPIHPSGNENRDHFIHHARGMVDSYGRDATDYNEHWHEIKDTHLDDFFGANNVDRNDDDEMKDAEDHLEHEIVQGADDHGKIYDKWKSGKRR